MPRYSAEGRVIGKRRNKSCRLPKRTKQKTPKGCRKVKTTVFICRRKAGRGRSRSALGSFGFDTTA